MTSTTLNEWTTALSMSVSSLFHVSIHLEVFLCLSWGQYIQYLIRLTFDVKEDGQLVSDTFLHCLLQSRDLLSTELVPADERQVFKAIRTVSPALLYENYTSVTLFTDFQSNTSYFTDIMPLVSLSKPRMANSDWQKRVWYGAYFSLWWRAASSLLSWANCVLPTGPEPLVVRSKVSSCISMGTPSAVKLRSSSTPVAPFLLA